MNATESRPAVHDMHDLRKIPVLSDEEQRTLARAAKAGDLEARNKLVASNLRFVASTAQRYRGMGVPFEDLLQEGAIGLMMAADRYDPDREIRFISYAVYWIRQRMRAAFWTAKNVRIPPNVMGRMLKVKRAQQKLESEYESRPSDEEVASHLSMDLGQATYLNALASPHYRLDADFENDDGAKGNRMERFGADLATSPVDFDEADLLPDLLRALEAFDEREATIIVRYYGLDQRKPDTLEVLGNRFGITRERIRQLRNRTLEKLSEDLSLLEILENDCNDD